MLNNAARSTVNYDNNNSQSTDDIIILYNFIKNIIHASL